jgi:hypothetical protein
MFVINCNSEGSGGIQVAEPAHKGINVTDETIWSSNTGRSSTGKMIGDVVARKSTIEVTWNVLTYAQAKQIIDAVRDSGDFFYIKYPDARAGINSDGSLKYAVKEVYAGKIPRELYSLHDNLRYYTGVQITFIQR